MKKVFKISYVLLFSFILVLFLISCGSSDTANNTTSQNDTSNNGINDDSSTVEYTITWKNYDGTTIMTSKCDYGSMPIYDGDTPVKQSTDEYNYVFEGWYPSLSIVKSSQEYTARFIAKKNKYRYVFYDENGTTELKNELVEYGEQILAPSKPTKAATAEYTYTFDGWYTALDGGTKVTDFSTITKNVTYYARYSSTKNKYTITWKNYDGETLETDTDVEYGTMPSYNDATPQKPSTAQYSYTFNNWDSEITTVTGDKVYTAKFTEKVNKYTITWKNDDGNTIDTTEVEYGKTPTHSDPVKTNNDEYTYTFSGWTPEITTVTGKAIYTATYSLEKNKYRYVFYDENGTTELKNELVEYGEQILAPSKPTKAATAEYTYTFDGWYTALDGGTKVTDFSTITKNVTYYARYSSTKNKYTITWKNYDGETLETDTDVEYGTMPSYNDATPQKPSTAQYSYTFNNWDSEITTVTGDKVYTAKFTEKVNKYTITWKNDDGNTIDTTEVEYGKTPTHSDPVKTNNDEYTYTFSGWTPEITTVTGEAIYTATYEIYIKYIFIYNDLHRFEIVISEYANIVDYYPTNSATNIVGDKKHVYDGWVNSEAHTYYENETIIQLYSITYVLNGGVNNTNNIMMLDEGSSFDLYGAAKNGFSFEGWYLESSFANKINNIQNISSNITLYANYTINNYTISYSLYGGINSIKNPSIYTIEDSITLYSPSKEGYTFKGWYLESGFKNKITTISGKYENVELHAKFNPNEYTAYLNSNGGVMSDNKKYTVTFIDYLMSSSGSKSSYSVIVNGGSSFNPYNYFSTSNYNCNATGEKFVGCYLDSNYTSLINSNMTIEDNLTIYVKWASFDSSYFTYSKLRECTVTLSLFRKSVSEYYYVGEGQSGVFKVSYSLYFKEYGSSSADSYIQIYCSDSGMIFNKHNSINGSCSGSYTVNAKPGDKIWIDLSANDNSYDNVSFTISNIQTLSSSITASNSNTYEKVIFDSTPNFPNYKKTGYVFSGWEYNEQFVDIENGWKIPNNATLVAQWELVNYDINYVLNGGENSSANLDNYNINSSIDLAPATKSGYDFIGWYTDANFKNVISKISKRTGNLTLYAKFEKSIYTLNLDANGGTFTPKVTFISDGTVINTQYLGSDDNLIYIEPYDKNNYIFGGWYLDEECTNAFNFSNAITDDIKLFAKWYSIDDSEKINTNTDLIQNISVDGKNYVKMAFVPKKNGTIIFTSSSAVDTLAYLYDSNLNLLTSSNDISDNDFNFSISYSVTKNRIYYLKFKAEQTSASGSVDLSITGLTEPSNMGKGNTYTTHSIYIVYEDVFELPVPFKEGLKFVGWFDENDNQIISGTWNHTENITIYAKWK